MEYKTEFNLGSFNTVGGATNVKEEIIEQDRTDEASEIIEQVFFNDEHVTKSEINDFIWFELADIMNLFD